MNLTDSEKAMLDGSHGKAHQKAMELLVRYGEALGCERFVDTNNVAGVPGTSNVFLENYYKQPGDRYDVIYSLFDLDSDEIIEVPRISVNSCHLQGGVDPENWETLGMKPEQLRISQAGEKSAESLGIKILKTCTPYLAGNVPKRGDHCAWMESSAVVYCNSVLGARTNTEGRESTSAAMITGKIPDWGFHRDDYRHATHRIDVEVPVESLMDWGMLGYFVGDTVGERVPVLVGNYSPPDLIRHKHFGAAAASSGGVEMYHIVGVTPEAPTLEAALGPNKPVETIKYGKAEQRRIYDVLNSRGVDRNVDYVMLGCPHAALEQIVEICKLLEGKKLHPSVRLWVFTSRAVRAIADKDGLSKIIRDAGGVVITDTCSAIGQALPPNTKVAALDSAKQTHYLPAIMNIQAWFGTTRDCINAALTGQWNGV
ncbi:MAG TPA: aconitase X catalytic domain-containing protein, partial [Steroidobacteraceae bacterium]|nr:aconitase X catalytic domain-containing protein [Steroidobacteraceae bacterium]